MKLKTGLVVAVTFLIVFLTYLTTIDKKVYYLALGDYEVIGLTNQGEITYGYTDYVKNLLKEKKKLEKYINGYAKDDARVTDLINDIQNNKKIMISSKEQTIKNALIKADLVTLSIGMNDLFYKIGVNPNFETLNYNELYYHVDEMMEDMEQLFKKLREYCKEDILVTSFYNPIVNSNEALDNVFTYANGRLKELVEQYDMTYVNIYQEFQNHENYLSHSLSIYPSKEGYEMMSQKIEAAMNQTLLKH
ncbi:MAG: hypothetical protein KH135_03185 [Firmicutes bacterium]|nr:hypothetical protein [Bacillota bacterium]